jgi:predicted Holliday junction resolvase-like endonuclease
MISVLKEKISQNESQILKRAQEQFFAWRDKELENVKTEQKLVAQREASTNLQKWVSENEARIRQDAIDRSQAVITGKVTEHLAPFLPTFPYNPKDTRFVGSPVDLIVFDGLDDEVLREIIFIEVKTGASSLSTRQRQIKDMIMKGKVKWIELKLNSGNSKPHA